MLYASSTYPRAFDRWNKLSGINEGTLKLFPLVLIDSEKKIKNLPILELSSFGRGEGRVGVIVIV